MGGQNSKLVQRVGNERLAAVGGCFPTPDLNHPIQHALRPAGRKTRARKYKELGCSYTRMVPAVCVSLLESATPWL